MALDWTLNCNEEKDLKLYIQAGFMRSGRTTDSMIAKILIRYMANTEESWYRYKRIEHSLIVNPSFTMRNKCIRSYKNLNEYLLNIQIEKLHVPNSEFHLNELCVVDSRELHRKGVKK